MKIGFFTDGYLPQINGVAASVENSAKALREKGHEVYIIAARYPDYKDDSKYVIRLSSIPVIKEWNLRVGTHLPEKALLTISKIDFDIIHGHSGGPIALLGFEYAKLKRVPYVFTYHTLFNKYTHYFLKGMVIKPKMAEVASKFFCNMCDFIIAPTKRIKNELISYGVTKPIAVIPSGIDIKKFDTNEKGYLRDKLGISKDKKILLYVGRFAKEKSVGFLIKSFEIVAKKEKESVLVLVGEGSKKEKQILQKLVTDGNLSKRVYFAGIVEPKDIAKAYSDGYLFLFSSDSETQGMVILESLASGLPIIAVDDKALEGVVLNGVNGFLTIRDEKEFSNRVIEVLENPLLRNKLSLEAKKTAYNFSSEKNAEEFDKLYKKILSSKK